MEMDSVRRSAFCDREERQIEEHEPTKWGAKDV
jgi:hypothetical protein